MLIYIPAVGSAAGTGSGSFKAKQEVVSSLIYASNACVFRMSWRVGQCVLLAERGGRRGDDPPLPLPPPAPVWKTR